MIGILEGTIILTTTHMTAEEAGTTNKLLSYRS